MEPQSETIDYQRLVLEALREVPRRALAQVAEEGMPGNHHFYLTFRTTDPEVNIPGFLRDLHPEEMSIILQHQFWSLAVDEKAFSVSLSFGGRRQQLYVPFGALTAFADPSASFLLRFDTPPIPPPAEEPAQPEAVRPAAAAAPASAGAEPGEVLRFDPSRRR